MLKILKWIYNLGWNNGYNEAVADAKAREKAVRDEKKFIKSLKD